MLGREVTLRPVEREDVTFLRDLANDRVVRENVVGWDWPLSAAGQLRWFDSGPDTAATRRFIVEDGSGMPIGLTGLWEIDWHSRTAMTALKLGGTANVRGQGWGTAAIHELMEFAFMDVGLHKLYSTILSSNEASLAAYIRKSNWVEEGRLREHVWKSGSYRDLVQIGMLRSEYLKFRGGA